MLKRVCSFLLLGLVSLTGCRLNTALYPVLAQPSQTAPPLPLRVKISVKGPKSGIVTIHLADGEICTGPGSPGETPNSPVGSMADTWNSVYGQGFYTAHVLGAHPFAALATGNRGTVFSVEWISPYQGVAKDNHGNIYKMTV
jgi:hypothetical protein